METTIMGYIGIIGYILGYYWDNGRENGKYYNGLYRDYRVYIGVIFYLKYTRIRKNLTRIDHTIHSPIPYQGTLSPKLRGLRP